MTTCCTGHEATGCASIPALTRPTYHFGQMLGQEEFLDEHRYFATKLALTTRYGIGHGVVCGLRVTVECRPVPGCPPPPCDGADHDHHEERRDELWVVVEPGIAIDCEGRLIVVRRPLERRVLDADGRVPTESVWLSVRFVELPVRPRRMLTPDPCDPCAASPFSRFCDGVDLEFSPKPPPDECDSCCGECYVPVTLAEIDPCCENVAAAVVDLRSPLGHRLTTIAAVNWQQGATYDSDELRRRLGDPDSGLMIQFSGPVHAATATARGVVEVEVLQGGDDPRGTSYVPKYDVVTVDEVDGLATTIRLVFHRGEKDRGPQVSDDDRILVRLRCDHILDKCCRAVDGNHIGGAVRAAALSAEGVLTPVTSKVEDKTESESSAKSSVESGEQPGVAIDVLAECAGWNARPLHRLGNGSEGGQFESWFYAKDNLS